jgi:preprotein translocase subunit Sec61beta
MQFTFILGGMKFSGRRECRFCSTGLLRRVDYTASIISPEYIVLGGLVVIVLAVVPKFLGFEPGRVRWIFMSYNNPQHIFLRKECKAFGFKSLDIMAC